MSISNPEQDSQWQDWQCYSGNPVPDSRLIDLLDKGSLTQRLMTASQGDFRVRLLSQGWQHPSDSETLSLGMTVDEKAIVREVELVCQGETWVTARSIIPKQTMTGEYAFLKDLGDKPLGEVLFKDKSLKRASFEICYIEHLKAWGRRSVFSLGEKPILVAEIFLPACPSLSKY